MICFYAKIFDITKIMTIFYKADGPQWTVDSSGSRCGYFHVDLYFVINIVTNHNS